MVKGVARKPAAGSHDGETQSHCLRAQCSECHWGVVRADRYNRRSHQLTPLSSPRFMLLER
jgi:hypothetical protein